MGSKSPVSDCPSAPEDYDPFFLEGQEAGNGGPGRASIPARLACLSTYTALSTGAFRYLDNKYNLGIHD